MARRKTSVSAAPTSLPRNPPARILVIRRDNIGDLVCTTPLLAALRQQLPTAHIASLVTRYNEAVLAGNPDIDALYSYVKAKHRRSDESVLAIYGRRLGTILELRRQKFDWVLLPGGKQSSSLRFARWIGGHKLLVRDDQDRVAGPHEVQQTCHLLVRMGLEYRTPATRVRVAADNQSKLKDELAAGRMLAAGPLIGLHISARKPSQRWPAEHFNALAQRLHESRGAKFLLLWAPGRQDDPRHPGDDEKAAAILAAAGGLPMLPVPTLHLQALIAALSLCDQIICGDGGAMHLAAGLGKPIVAMFGQSAPERWRPWGVPHVVLQKPSLSVADIGVDEVIAAYRRLDAGMEPIT